MKKLIIFILLIFISKNSFAQNRQTVLISGKVAPRCNFLEKILTCNFDNFEVNKNENYLIISVK